MNENQNYRDTEEAKEALKEALIASGVFIAAIGFSYMCGRAIGYHAGFSKGTIATDRCFKKFLTPEAYQGCLDAINKFMSNASANEVIALSKELFI